MQLHPTKRTAPVTVAPGRTYTSTYDGVLIWAQVYPTAEAAEKHAQGMRDRDDRTGWQGWTYAVV